MGLKCSLRLLNKAQKSMRGLLSGVLPHRCENILRFRVTSCPHSIQTNRM